MPFFSGGMMSKEKIKLGQDDWEILFGHKDIKLGKQTIQMQSHWN